jgi:hypothetical protein
VCSDVNFGIMLGDKCSQLEHSIIVRVNNAQLILVSSHYNSVNGIICLCDTTFSMYFRDQCCMYDVGAYIVKTIENMSHSEGVVF